MKKAIISQVSVRRPSTKLGSPEKRPRHRDELEQQSDTFGRDWRAGDRVMTWLNRHEGRVGELSRLVEDGWSWADIGRAMHLAGITYRTGAPISAAILRKKASEARTAARTKSAPPWGAMPDSDAPEPPVQQKAPPPPSPARVSVPPAETNCPIGDEEPAFKPATLVGHSRKKPPEALPLPTKEPVPAPSPTIDVDEILARFTGRK